MVPNANKYFPTTIDNPFNPFVDWEEWYNFDQFKKGYRTLDRLDKFYKTSELIGKSLDEFLYSLALEKFLDYFPHYIIVTAETEIKPIKIEVLESNLGISNDENGHSQA